MRTSISRRAFSKSALLGSCTALLFAVLCPSSVAAEPRPLLGGGSGGFLTVSSVPPAKIFVDEQDMGRTTPVENLPLPAGDHKLTLVSVTNNGALKRSLGFTITAGQTTRLKINL
ncbi:PEGA domain-containing protein [Pendulispora albinea]|uniref:PEGA domain-containing protein n=1 Tax=Pendulispora albinea TaxID=2741071 RepID=A0ABZ2LXN3_9BACT